MKVNEIYDAIRTSEGKSVAQVIREVRAGTKRIRRTNTYESVGWLRSVQNGVLRAIMPSGKIGEICKVVFEQNELLAEVIAIEGDIAVLSAFGPTHGLKEGALIRSCGREMSVKIGDDLLGRVIDPLGGPIDGLGPIKDAKLQPVRGNSVPAMEQPLIDQPFLTGVTAIDVPNLLGRGQRIGIFGPAGVGKSSLLSAIARNASADVIVLGLIGERAREVREFLQRNLPEDSRQRVACITSTSDRPPMERLYAAHTANRVAEHFRDQGKSVLLILDSLTRIARALREIGLAAGEPPARRGFPASVYSALPGIIERSGTSPKGTITAIYSVLTEAQISDDPIAEEVASLTDGHLILSRELAERSQYPAIDPISSVSRLMSSVGDKEHVQNASRMRQLMARYREVEMLIQIGEYQPGTDAELDVAVAGYPEFNELLAQSLDEERDLESDLETLSAILQ